MSPGDPATGSWPAQRWTIADARSAGLRVVAENPGPPAAASAGGAPDSDPVVAQARRAPAAAATCGADLLLWAFEDTLFDPTSGVGPQDLGGLRPTP